MSPSLVFEPTYRAIKERLLRGAWPGGYRLDTARLAVDLGVSTSPVRDSLNRLAGERMIDFGVGEGFHVPRLDEKRLRDLFDLNLHLLLAAISDGVVIKPSLQPTPRIVEGLNAKSLFLHLAGCSGNHELLAAASGTLDRLSPLIQLDAIVLEKPYTDLFVLDQAMAANAALPEIRSLLAHFHERRKALAERYVAYFSAGPELRPSVPERDG